MSRPNTALRYLWEKDTPEVRVELEKLFKTSLRGYKLVHVLNALEHQRPDLNLYWNWWNDDQLREVL